MPVGSDPQWAAKAAWDIPRIAARDGRRVALVDLCLENPALHETVGLQATEGIVDAFEYGVSLNKAAHTTRRTGAALGRSGRRVRARPGRCESRVCAGTGCAAARCRPRSVAAVKWECTRIAAAANNAGRGDTAAWAAGRAGRADRSGTRSGRMGTAGASARGAHRAAPGCSAHGHSDTCSHCSPILDSLHQPPPTSTGARSSPRHVGVDHSARRVRLTRQGAGARGPARGRRGRAGPRHAPERECGAAVSPPRA